MHRAVWYVGMVALGIAGAFSFMASYACNHPHALISRCLVAGYQLSTRYNPCYLAATALLDARDPQAFCMASPACANACAAVAEDEEESATFRLPGKVDIELESCRGQARIVIGDAVPLVPLLEEIGAPRLMPYAVDLQDAPEFMPYVSDSDSDNRSLSGFWHFILGMGKPASCPLEAVLEAVAPDLRVLFPSESAEDRSAAAHRHSQSYKLTQESFERELERKNPSVDTLEIRPGDVKPYRFQPLPF